MIDFFGRKIALLLTALPFSVGWLMIGFGKVPGLLHSGRFFSGVGVGCASLIVPVSNEVVVLLEVRGKKTAARGECRRSQSYLASVVTSCSGYFFSSYKPLDLLVGERAHSKFPNFYKESFSSHNLW